MTKLGMVSVVVSFCMLTAVRGADFDGDGTEDVFIFRPATGLWAVRGVTRTYFGNDGDIPVPGDYDGSGFARPAVFRPGSGLWTVSGLTRFYFGRSADRPVPEDYSGDGKDDFAVFRPSGGLWAVRRVTRLYFGVEGDTPVAGVYDGTGICRPAIFRSSTGLWAARGVSRVYFGDEADTPVPGDYDGIGIQRPAVFRSNVGRWAVWNLTRFYFGRDGDQAKSGDFNGDGKDDFKIYRASNGFWAARGVTRFYFGGADQPDPEDPIDLSRVRWMDADVSGWTETARLTARHGGSYMIVDYDKAGVWPPGEFTADGSPLVGNPWIFIKVNGAWVAQTWEWLRPNQTSKNISSVSGDHFVSGEMRDWSPVSGETYGFMVSTQARRGYRSPVNERSNVSMVVWP